jgi:hypothetical protein
MHTTGKSLAAFLAFIGNHSISDLPFLLPVRASKETRRDFVSPKQALIIDQSVSKNP